MRRRPALAVATAQLANDRSGHARRGDRAEAKPRSTAPRPILRSRNRPTIALRSWRAPATHRMQRLDEATNSLQVAQRGSDQAKLAYDEAVNGYTPRSAASPAPMSPRRRRRSTPSKAQVDELVVKRADRGAGLPDRRRARRICLARRAAAVAGRSERRLAALRSARGSRQGLEDRRPLPDAGARARGQDDRRRRSR